MKLNRENQTCCDAEIGHDYLINKFITNMDNLHTDDRNETLRSILYYNPKFTILEFISTFNAVVDKLK